MAFHLCGFYESVGAGSSLETLTPIEDDVLGSEDDAIVSSTANSLFAGLGMGTDLNRVRISTPSMRSVAAPFLRPIISQGTMITNPNVAEWLDAPLAVAPGEGFSAMAVHDNVGAQAVHVLLWLAQEFEPAPDGPVLTIRGESTTETTLNVWSDITINWDSPLALGHYAVVASECVTDNALAFRWKFDQQGYRPDGISQGSIGGRTHQYFGRPGKLGTWGHISAQVMPRLQVLSTANSSVHTIFLQVVRID